MWKTDCFSGNRGQYGVKSRGASSKLQESKTKNDSQNDIYIMKIKKK